jgi:hypothetical protein
MGLITLFENLNFNIFCRPKKRRKTKEDAMENLYRVSKEYKLSILPISNTYELDNLYPITDRVKEWNTFVIGNDKTYILANIGDKKINLNSTDLNIVDTKGSKLPNELFRFFDNVWTHTLEGKQLQFYIVLNGKLYLINTYCLRNENKKVIGAIMFMRDFDTLPETYNQNISHTMNKSTHYIMESTNQLMHTDSPS